MLLKQSTIKSALAKQYEHSLKECLKIIKKKIKWEENLKIPDATNTKANANAYQKASYFKIEIQGHLETINELEVLFINHGKYDNLREELKRYEHITNNLNAGYNPYGLGCSVGSNKRKYKMIEVEL